MGSTNETFRRWAIRTFVMNHDDFFLTQVLSKTVKKHETINLQELQLLQLRHLKVSQLRFNTFSVPNLRLTIYVSCANDADECRPSTGT